MVESVSRVYRLLAPGPDSDGPPPLTGEKTFCQEGAPAHTRGQTFPPSKAKSQLASWGCCLWPVSPRALWLRTGPWDSKNTQGEETSLQWEPRGDLCTQSLPVRRREGTVLAHPSELTKGGSSLPRTEGQSFPASGLSPSSEMCEQRSPLGV